MADGPHDGVAGLPHPGTGNHCQKIRAEAQALCDQGGCRHSGCDRGDLDLGYFRNQGEDFGGSWLAVLGQWIETVFQPLGLDLHYGVAIVGALIYSERDIRL